jgi:hypothetical protein
MKNSARAMLCVQQKNVLATTGRSHRHAKRPKIYRNVRETAPKCVVVARSEPKLRITPPMQAEIIALYMQGCSLSDISRRTIAPVKPSRKPFERRISRPRFKNREENCLRSGMPGPSRLTLL